jgi:GT2 family glycosyltransferase
MNITFVLAVYNNLKLTKECYKRLRQIYPEAPLAISSGGSNDGTKEWLELLEDKNLSFFHDDDRLTFSQTYNAGIDLVDTEKLVLIHNDMVIGEGFLEALERLLTENMILSYTTIEPPIFKDHERAGKVILDLGSGFDDFNDLVFNDYVQKFKNNDTLYEGSAFFMSAYKKTFIDLTGFDGVNFFPCFCEDDDFLIRAKLKGYELKTCGSAITYHFVSQTSRYSEDIKNKRSEIEACSNKNFVRKWGLESSTFNTIIKYQSVENFIYNHYKICLVSNHKNVLTILEPFVNKIKTDDIPEDYISETQPNTRFDLKSKFENTDDVDVILSYGDILTIDDLFLIKTLQLDLLKYEIGIHKIGNWVVEVKNKI